MIYSQVSYFDGYHFQHIAEWYDRKRVQRLREKSLSAANRRYVR